MNHTVLFVEDLSTKYFLEGFLEIHYANRFTYEIINFQGKQDMLQRIDGYLAGYTSWAPNSYRYVILIDRDLEDCMSLKNKLESILLKYNIQSKRSSILGYKAFSWIAIEELESWYFGNFTALTTAFPRMPDKSHTARYRNPDSIAGGTWETLERELKAVGYYGSGLLKLDLAKKMSKIMTPLGNTSLSFNGFVERLNSL